MGTFESTRAGSNLQPGSLRATVFRRLRVALAVILATAFALFHLTALLPVPNSPELPSRGQLELEFEWHSIKPKMDIEWIPCYVDQKCARLLLPLDYDTPEGPTTAIAIRMIPAQDHANYRGTIFLNPGGPGGSGVGLIDRRGKNISRIVGPAYDVLSFDPRGIGYTTPLASCFDSKAQRDIWASQEGYRLMNASDGSVAIYRARAKMLGERCADRIGGEWGIGRFAGTAYVARDMLEMTQKLGQPKLQYWGFSYGTALGQYFAAMFPDKVKRIVLDGVIDGESYRHARYETDIEDVQAIAESLFTFCHAAGTEKCALYDASPAKIRERFHRILHAVDQEPIAIPLAEPPVLITRKALAEQLFSAAYRPLAAFTTVADTFRAIEDRNSTVLTALARNIVSPAECACESGSKPSYDEARFPVECGDGEPYSFDATEFARFYAALEDASPLLAPVWGTSWLYCAEWPVRPKMRYTGPVGAPHTAHPLLLVSTRFDPVTPLAQARRARARFAGAGLLVQESYGHCSTSSPSLCTARAIRAYFDDGTLPEEGATCEVDELPFVGARDVGAMRALSAEDMELLEALRGLGETIHNLGRD